MYSIFYSYCPTLGSRFLQQLKIELSDSKSYHESSTYVLCLRKTRKVVVGTVMRTLSDFFFSEMERSCIQWSSRSGGVPCLLLHVLAQTFPAKKPSWEGFELFIWKRILITRFTLWVTHRRTELVFIQGKIMWKHDSQVHKNRMRFQYLKKRNFMPERTDL